MLFPTTSRDFNGVYIVGQLVGLRLHPHAEGTISVTVVGLPAITGLDVPCRLSTCDDLPEFEPAGIEVHDTRLECFAVDPCAPVLRTGFMLEIEPGMAPLLRTWLAKLTTVADASKAIADKFDAQLLPPIHHMLDAVTSVVARIALDTWEVEHSVAYEREHGIWANERAFMDVFNAEGVMQDLHALASAQTQQAADNSSGA